MQILNGSSDSRFSNLLSLGISKSYDISPINPNRLYIQSSMSFKSLPRDNNYQYYPDIGFGYKVSKNLALEGSVFNYSMGGFSDQIIRVGVQYYFGSGDTLSWVSSLKKVDYKSIKNFNLSNITLEFSKWIKYRHNFFRFGFGSNFYVKDNFLHKQRGQVNFFLLNTIIPIKFLQLSFETRINLHTFFYSFSLLKDFY
tara:strand:- start:455 stop:1048 length:594 start_codon:yes stop_codon:yes gene_type:complete